MKEMGLESVSTNSKKEYKKRLKEERKDNLLKQQFYVEHPNTVWTCDFTSFSFKNKRIYLCIIIDLFSRKVIAYKISLYATTNSLTSTFKRAVKERCPIYENLMFHSDQGSQFTSYTFRILLKQLGVKQSFSNPGNPYNNSVSESFFSHFKREELYRREYRSEKDFCKCVTDYISFYNEKRPHKTIGYKTPMTVEANYYKKNDIGQGGSEI
jgi:transposase InsO family protein